MNYIEHKAKHILGFYGKKEHKGKCQCLAKKRGLNRIFDVMGLCYTNRDGPSTSLPNKDVAPHGHGAQGQRGCWRKFTAWRGANAVTLKLHKRKRGWQGQGISKPVDIRIGQEIAGKVGNNKKVVIG